MQLNNKVAIVTEAGRRIVERPRCFDCPLARQFVQDRFHCGWQVHIKLGRVVLKQRFLREAVQITMVFDNF